MRISAPAEREYREAVEWYRERDPRVAERFAAEARRTLDLLEEFPSIGGRVPRVDDRHVRRMPIPKFPYHVIFVELDEWLEVVAFAHYRREPMYFMSRIRSK